LFLLGIFILDEWLICNTGGDSAGFSPPGLSQSSAKVFSTIANGIDDELISWATGTVPSK
jgi:hypothetical protein